MLFHSGARSRRNTPGSKNPLQGRPNLLEVVVAAVQRVEEEVVVLNAALEAAVEQNQSLLLTQMAQRPMATARILLLPPKLQPKEMEAGIPYLRTATRLPLLQMIGPTTLERMP